MDLTYLFPLLRAAIYEKAPEEFPVLDKGQWESLIATARQQTVTGLLFQGVSLLPEGYPLPEDIMFTLVAEAGRIRARSRKVASVAMALMEKYRSWGLHPVVMKGPAVARFYPDPLLRESGDIDMYFCHDEFKRAVELSGKTVKVGDGSPHFKSDGIDIDLHSRYFDVHCRNLPEIPSPQAMLLMLSSHILKHAMGPGIGLRQLCDLAMAYRRLEVPAGEVRKCFADAGLEKWNILLFSFLEDNLCAESLYDKTVPTAPLMQIISGGGNFGHYAIKRDKVLKAKPLRRKIDTVRRYIVRLPFSLRYAPRELFHSIGDLLKGNFHIS